MNPKEPICICFLTVIPEIKTKQQQHRLSSFQSDKERRSWRRMAAAAAARRGGGPARGEKKKKKKWKLCWRVARREKGAKIRLSGENTGDACVLSLGTADGLTLLRRRRRRDWTCICAPQQWDWRRRFALRHRYIDRRTDAKAQGRLNTHSFSAFFFLLLFFFPPPPPSLNFATSAPALSGRQTHSFSRAKWSFPFHTERIFYQYASGWICFQFFFFFNLLKNKQ